MKEKPVLLCLRVDEAKPEAIFPGSEQTNCHLCHSPVWIAPSGKATLAERNAQVVCRICLGNIPDQDQEIQITRKVIKEFVATAFHSDAEILLQKPQATYLLLKAMYEMVHKGINYNMSQP